MIPINVRILEEPEVLPSLPSTDGATQKRVKFELLRPDVGWLFQHVITFESLDFDRKIDKLQAHGGIRVNVPEYQGDDPRSEWKDNAVLIALSKADEVSWDGGAI